MLPLFSWHEWLWVIKDDSLATDTEGEQETHPLAFTTLNIKWGFTIFLWLQRYHQRVPSQPCCVSIQIKNSNLWPFISFRINASIDFISINAYACIHIGTQPNWFKHPIWIKRACEHKDDRIVRKWVAENDECTRIDAAKPGTWLSYWAHFALIS